MLSRFAVFLAATWPAVARAEDGVVPFVPAGPISSREAFLASIIGAMLLCGLVSFLLRGRVSVRTHVALAMFVVLVGGFGLFVLFQVSSNSYPLAAVVCALGVVALFRLMSQFESLPKSSRTPVKD